LVSRLLGGPKLGARAVFWCAWSLWALSVVTTATLLAYNAIHPLPATIRGSPAEAVIAVAFIGGFATVGALLGWKRPANPIGGLAGKVFLVLAGGGAALVVLSGVAAIVSLVFRYRRARVAERAQLKWLVFAAGLIVVAVLASIGAPSQLQNAVASGAIAAVPVAIGVAIFRYHLYDIDLVINKTLVYGSLAAFITGVYVAIVVGIGALLQQGARPSLVLSILATTVVTVAFQPVRERVQRLANHLVYGKRATPYEALSTFAGQLGATVPAEDLLPQLARVLADATGATRTQVWLCADGHLRLGAAYSPDNRDDAERRGEAIALPPQGLPDFPGATTAFEVSHAGERLGALTLAKRPGEALTPVERRLAAQLAAQAGLVLHNAGLTGQLNERLAELRASRKRIVAAADGERRRLERNIHDGAQQQLVALSVLARLAETSVDSD